MSIKLTSTKRSALENGLKVLVYGLAGTGKTRLCATTGEPTVIISAEAGLLSLREIDIPVIEVKTIDDLSDAYRFVLGAAEAAAFRWICIDSISEIAETILSTEKKLNKDPRHAYGALNEQMADLVRLFRDLPGRNVYMSAKMDRIKDDATGAFLYVPSAPGKTVGPMLPYLFDEVFALRVEKDAEGRDAAWLQTRRDFQYDAKDRSGALDAFEPPNLAAIAAKITLPAAQAAIANAASAATAAPAAIPHAAQAAETQGA